MIISPESVYKLSDFQNVLKKIAEVATNNCPFNTKAFQDMQAHWWLFEVEQSGKAVHILAVTNNKVMNI